MLDEHMFPDCLEASGGEKAKAQHGTSHPAVASKIFCAELI